MSIQIDNIGSLNSKRCEKPQIAFRGEQTPVNMEQKPDTFENEKVSTEIKEEQTPDTPEKEKMSTGKKIGIISGSILGLIAAGFGIKKGLDYKAVKNAAKAVGMEDTKLFKQMQKVFGKVTKFEGETEKLELSDLLRKIDKLNEQGLLKEGDRCILLSPKLTQEGFNTTFKDGVLPENAFMIAIERNGKNGTEYVHQEIILNKGLGETITELPQDKIVAIPIKL